MPRARHGFFRKGTSTVPRLVTVATDLGLIGAENPAGIRRFLWPSAKGRMLWVLVSVGHLCTVWKPTRGSVVFSRTPKNTCALSKRTILGVLRPATKKLCRKGMENSGLAIGRRFLWATDVWQCVIVPAVSSGISATKKSTVGTSSSKIRRKGVAVLAS